MATVALVVHPEKDEAAVLAKETIDWLFERDHDVRMPSIDAALIGRPELGVDDDGLGPGAALAVSIGGDGTVLRTVDLVAPASVPVLAVNVGQLGYLTEIEPPELFGALERFFAGEHHIEDRMLLDVTVESTGVHAIGLNEAVLEKTPMGHTVRLAVSIDGDPWTTYAADGLIVATPTGSTAYSLSARGPIVAPELRALVLTPVSPHQLFDRSMVFTPETVLRVEVTSYRPATLSVDGRILGALAEGTAVVCTAADKPAHFVSFAHRKFHQILKVKFGLADR
jgi:NAD+ kinase